MNKIQQIWLDYKTRLNEKRKSTMDEFQIQITCCCTIEIR